MHSATNLELELYSLMSQIKISEGRKPLSKMQTLLLKFPDQHSSEWL